MTPTAIATRSDRIQRTLEHLRHGSTDTVDRLVPFGPGQYTDPELAQRERELVFGRVPSIVAHASELPEPNDFITLTMPRNRVIVARQPDGSVKAFVNVCRHRGAMLEEQVSGRCRLFSCGYHRWSYNIDGSLRAITRENTFGPLQDGIAGTGGPRGFTGSFTGGLPGRPSTSDDAGDVVRVPPSTARAIRSAARSRPGVSCSDDSLRFTVTDSGTGFDTTTTRYGAGLQGMATD